MKLSRQKNALRMGAVFAALSLSFAALAQDDPPGFVQTFPEQIKWTQAPALPSGGLSASIYGNAQKPTGYYINRVKLPADFKVPPHSHPEESVYTVISGTFYIGYGDKFDPAKLKAFPAGSTFVVPANTSHFHWMRSGEAVAQITGIGPNGFDYVDHADDPRKK
jgi:quercetin dioxygenase-like cupin family protein